MNLNELEKDIIDHKERFNELCKEEVEIMLLLQMLSKKILNGICDIQESKYKLNNSEADALISTFVSGDKDYMITPTKLHQKLLFTTGGMAKVLKKLEKKQLIIRVENQHDKRSSFVKLTPDGITLVKEVFNDLMIYQEKVYGTLTKKEKETFKKLVKKVLKEI